jgi:hypothetical protein
MFGTFAEVFRIPPNVDRATVTGTYEHGLLHVTLPKIPFVPTAPGAIHSFLQNPVFEGAPTRRMVRPLQCTGAPALFSASDPQASLLFNAQPLSAPRDIVCEAAMTGELLPEAIEFVDPSTGASFNYIPTSAPSSHAQPSTRSVAQPSLRPGVAQPLLGVPAGGYSDGIASGHRVVAI